MPSIKPFDRKGTPSCSEESQETKRRGFEDVYYVAHTLNPKFNGECLSRDSLIKKKTEFIEKVATRKSGSERSAEVVAELAEYRSREGFFGKAFVLKSATVMRLFGEKRVCYDSKLAKVAVSVLMMPATSAVMDGRYIT